MCKKFIVFAILLIGVINASPLIEDAQNAHRLVKRGSDDDSDAPKKMVTNGHSSGQLI